MSDLMGDDEFQKLSQEIDENLAEIVQLKLHTQQQKMECELKDIRTGYAKFYKVGIDRQDQVASDYYLVKSIECNDINIINVIVQYKLQLKFGCEMMCRLKTHYHEDQREYLVFDFIDGYYHNDLKASNYLIIQENPFKISLSDFETFSNDKGPSKKSESYKQTPDYSYKSSLGKDILYGPAELDVKNIIESIKNIVKQQTKYQEQQILSEGTIDSQNSDKDQKTRINECMTAFEILIDGYLTKDYNTVDEYIENILVSIENQKIHQILVEDQNLMLG
eukprot:403353620